MKSGWLRLIALCAGLLLCAGLVVDAGARESTSLRSGSFLVDARSNGVLGPLYGCYGSVDCAAWVASCAQPASAETGVTSSIVDVSRLAGSRRTRTLAITDRTSLPGEWGGGVTVELWTGSCQNVPIPGHPGGVHGVSTARFTIPKGVAWLTVTSGQGWLATAFGSFDVHWALR